MLNIAFFNKINFQKWCYWKQPEFNSLLAGFHCELKSSYFSTQFLKKQYSTSNKKNNKRFNNRSCSLFFLMGIFLKHLWLIRNILQRQNCKSFTMLVPLQSPSRSSHWRCSVKKDILKNVQNFTGKHLCWSLL